MTDTPIRTHSRKGFIIGWIAIVLVGALAFALASMPLHYSQADLRIARNAHAPAIAIPLG